MADHAEFSASELDHLEDALEGLELAPPGDGAPQIRRRLEEYRNILALSRAAMPRVEVPRGLLNSVLAEARASVESPAITPSVAVPERESFWAKVRRFGLLPGVALAGTAAAVLFMVERKDETAQVAAVSHDAKVATAAEVRKEAAFIDSESAPAAPGASAPSAGRSKDVAAAAEPSATPSAPGATTIAPAPPPASPEAERKREDAAAEIADSPNDDDAGDVQTRAGAKGDKKLPDAETPRWDIIARGDRARHRSDCKVARNEYALALDDVDARVRARAHAGLGLCDAADGDRKSADAAYTAARELDGEIVAFIDEERPRAAGTSPAKAKPKAASKKSKVDVPAQQQNAMDPL